MKQEAKEKLDQIEKVINKNRMIKFYKILSKFFIWAILLFFSYNYINANPAEKTSIISWFSIIYQKAQMFFYWFFDTESKSLLEDKFNLERSYNELLTFSNDVSCKEKINFEEIQNKITELQTSSLDEYKQNKLDFYKKFYEYNTQIKDNCN